MGWFQQLRRRVGEALIGGGWSDTIDAEEVGYRRLTGRSGPRDLDPLSQEQMLKVCRWLYDAHPMAGWIIDHRVGLICGDEVGFSVEVDPEQHGGEEAAAKIAARIKRRLESAWDSPNFSIRYRADEIFTSFLVDGELCLPVAGENEIDGLPQLDMTNTAEIKAVELLPGSGLVAETVVLKPKTATGEDRRLRIVRLNPETGLLEGECFFFRHSRLANAVRGRSDLIRQADWLDLLDQQMFARADKAIIANSLVFDIALKGAGQPEIDKKREELRRAPLNKPGTHYVHNDQEALQMVTADLHSEDATNEMKHLQNFILGSKSVPESWFGGGGEVTRTTAGEQNDVALMVLRRDRKMVRTILGTILNYAYDRLSSQQPSLYPPRAAGVLIEPDLPPLDEKDISRLGGVVQNIVAALAQAIVEGLISRQTARATLLHIIDRLGVPVDPDTEKAQIDREAESDELTKMARAQQMAASRLGDPPAEAAPDAEDDEAA